MTGGSTRLIAGILVMLVAACSSVPRQRSSPAPAAGATAPADAAPSSRYYKDDGPGDAVPANLDAIPDAIPRRETLNRFASRPYTVLGRDYVPATELKPYRERGVASWYGRKFHGQKTAIGETYDMYAMTAAHPTLPLPSYARVTNVATGQSVVVRVNDRGPFLHDRIVDLSYAAAHRIGVAQKGSGEVIVESVIPGDNTIATALPPVAATPVESMVQPASPSLRPSQAASPSPSNPLTPVSPPSSQPAADGNGRFVVQLGAFRDYGNAQNFLSRTREQVAVVAGEPRISQIKGLWRVYVGPYDNEADAKRMGDRLYSAIGIDNTVAQH
jgi:peptidoglycan lytic transglycosylase